MQTNLITRGLVIPQNLKDFLDRKLAFALDRFQLVPADVDMTIEDINGPRGGPDKRCRLRVGNSKRTRVLIEETGSDLQRVLSRTVDRMEQALAKLHRKHHSRAARQPRKSLAVAGM
jgi:ribosome-associated translation inhibitor RaiA